MRLRVLFCTQVVRLYRSKRHADNSSYCNSSDCKYAMNTVGILTEAKGGEGKCGGGGGGGGRDDRNGGGWREPHVFELQYSRVHPIDRTLLADLM